MACDAGILLGFFYKKEPSRRFALVCALCVAARTLVAELPRAGFSEARAQHTDPRTGLALLDVWALI